MNKFYYLEDMTQEELNKLALERNILAKENQQLRKQKDDVVEYMKNYIEVEDAPINERIKIEFKELLRMLGEIDG